MIVTYLDAKIDVVCIHQVGNKIADEGIRFSQRPFELSTELYDILLKLWGVIRSGFLRVGENEAKSVCL